MLSIFETETFIFFYFRHINIQFHTYNPRSKPLQDVPRPCSQSREDSWFDSRCGSVGRWTSSNVIDRRCFLRTISAMLEIGSWSHILHTGFLIYIYIYLYICWVPAENGEQKTDTIVMRPPGASQLLQDLQGHHPQNWVSFGTFYQILPVQSGRGI